MKLHLGLDSKEFAEEYDEIKPYLRRKALDADFTIQDFEDILYVVDPSSASMKVRLRNEIEKKEYIEQVNRLGKKINRINRQSFNDLMDKGATLIINGVDGHSRTIRKICNQLSQIIGQEVRANAYYTLGSESTFGFHWDPHDVFAVQLFGCKKWTLHKPTVQMPIPNMTRTDSGPDTTGVGMQITLAPGDMLYVPRGWWHNVEGSGEPTLHLAFGVQILHYANYITWACRWLLREHEQCRKKIKLDGSDPEGLTKAVEVAFKEIARHENLMFFLEKFVSNFRLDENFGLDSCQRPWREPEVEISLATSYREAFVSHAVDSLNGTKFREGTAMDQVVEVLKCHVRISIEELERLSKIDAAKLDEVLVTLNKSEHISLTRGAVLRKEQGFR